MVNAVLERILATQSVTDGDRLLPLRHPDFPTLPVAIDPAEGQLLQHIVMDVRPRVSLEIGCAYGVSTLYICEALTRLSHPACHIVIDPFQRTQWRDIGRKHLAEAGFESIVTFKEEPAELVLPALVRDGVQIDFAFVDGWHTFDQVMVEFYFLNRLLRVGGVAAFDDSDRRSVNRVLRHALTYPNYREYGTSGPPPASVRVVGGVGRGLVLAARGEVMDRLDVLHGD